MGVKSNPECYLLASAFAATVNYPLWKASAIAQSGFAVPSKGIMNKFIFAMSPPYRGVPAVITGMTWARAAIFYGSDWGRGKLNQAGAPEWAALSLPPLVFSSMVQVFNMPIVRASITMQNPAHYDNPNFKTTTTALRYLAREKGVKALWHGLSAGIAKTVPKYVTSVVVKDVMEDMLPQANNEAEFVARAAVKSIVAGVAGAALTNPMDVIRNEMFKTDLGLVQTVKSLQATQKGWVTRGLYANLIAVSIPITVTIFLTDVFVRMKKNYEVSPMGSTSGVAPSSGSSMTRY